MSKRLFLLLSLVLWLPAAPAWADEYADTIKIFRNAGQSAGFFKTAYGYAVFPTIAKGGVGVGAAYGTGRVYERGRHVGNTSMTQVSLGLQLGGQAYRQIIFFEDEEAFRRFTSGNFEFGAEASAVAITLGASAKATSTGTSAGASASQRDATTAGKYHRGMAVFTVAKGGLMYEAVVAGQKFSYEKLK
ncbi:YSC84-related protein [Azohydromonas sediminis]|uniref:lipid-binding SYLF domain-containing protein n=1 Tax=Azohydromonas sediminis TaxID=2259674 RepID=UPI000E65E977|nr:lipid-binding SYLF domain-containing protein [Azohydromonas sediminis]